MTTPNSNAGPLLFSIDLEEFYPAPPSTNPRSTPLPLLVENYLSLLEAQKIKATFFVVGDVARKYPSLITEIASAGHEIGCHSDHHYTLDQFTPKTFAEDLRRNRGAITSITNVPVSGFRAPLASLTKRTSWAHSILAQEGFTYSSSIISAINPLYGWPEFGTDIRKIDGIWEIPLTLSHIPAIGTFPVFCGTYFRILPWWVVRRHLLSRMNNTPLACYFHPYDIDYQQPWCMHAGVRGSLPMNLLLFLRRKSLTHRLGKLLSHFQSSSTYADFLTIFHQTI